MKSYEARIKKSAMAKLSKLVPLATDKISEDLVSKSAKFGIVNESNTCMITAKTEEANELLHNFADVDSTRIYGIDGYREHNLKIEYTTDGNVIYAGCAYDPKYLKPVFDFLSIFDEYVRISTLPDLPMTVENDQFIIILAGRVYQ